MAGSGLGGKYALIGMAESDVGIVPDKSPRELCVQVTLEAIRDAGLTLADVDGLITCNAFAEPISITQRPSPNILAGNRGTV